MQIKSTVRTVEELNEVPVEPEGTTFTFRLASRAKTGAPRSDDYITALGDTGANCNIARPSIIAAWEKAGCIIESQKLRAVPIKLGGKTAQPPTPIVRRVRVRLAVLLEGYDLHIDEWFCEWPDLTEAAVISYCTLKRHFLLAYMQSHIAPMAMAPEELLLDQLRVSPPRADDFVQTGEGDISDATLDTMLADPLRVNPDFPELDRLRRILKQYGPRLFSPRDSTGLLVKPAVLRLKEGAQAQLPRQPCRFVSKAVLPHLEYELAKMEKLRIIRRVTSDVACCSPLCIAAKADGYIRIAVDYRLINDLLLGTALTIPQLDLLFDYFRDGRYFAGLDQLDGYFNHPIAEESKYLTTFVTPFGLFQFNFLPQGISVSPGIFSSTINHDILADIVHPKPPGERAAVNFIDDTGISGSTPTQLCDRLERTLEALHRRNVRLKWGKCRFGFEHLDFCGHVFTPTGYHLSQERKQGVVDLPPPSTVKKLRSFIGLCIYFSKFVPHLNVLLAPLSARTNEVGRIALSPVELEAFEACKFAIAGAGQLSHLQEGGDLVLYTDASVDGIGGFLVQRINGEELPIAFVSHKFSKAAAKWSTIEQEAYAIVFCVLRLETHLLGRRFLIRTDHKNLVYILGSNVPKLVRWRLRLAEFEFDIEHVAGTDNVVADHLSRLNSIHLVNPEAELDILLPQLHNSILGHSGSTRLEHMLDTLRPGWADVAGARSKVRDFVRTCPECQKLKGSQRVLGERDTWHHLHSLDPFTSISADLWGPFPKDLFGNQYIVGIVCNLTKFAMGIPVKDATALSAAFALVQWASIFGWFRTLRTDKGSNFTSEVITRLVEVLGVKHILILPGHHEANGIIERRFRETARHLRAMLFNPKLRESWSLAAPIAFGIANAHVDRLLGVSPARMVFGPFAQSFDAMALRAKIRKPDSVDDFKAQLDTLSKECMETSKAYFAEQIRLEERRAKARIAKSKPSLAKPLVPGAYVLMEYNQPILPRAPTKLHPPFKGPLVVLDVSRPDIVVCRDLVTKSDVEVHTDQLREFAVPDYIMPHDLIHYALADHMLEWIVEGVIGHRFREGRKSTSTLELNIRWAGYDEPTWERYALVKDAARVDEYVLHHGLPRTKEAE